jgi:phosphate transport system permease protein
MTVSGMRYLQRRTVNVAALGTSVAATIFTIGWLAWILEVTFTKGLEAFGLPLFTQDTPPPGSPGGLRNAFAGSVLMIAIGVVVGVPLGVLTGTFLAEFGGNGRIGATVRFVNDILLSAPSIVIGLFVYTLVVIPMGNFSGLAGGLSLALVILPIVVRTTDEMLRLVPQEMREAALALGAPRWVMIVKVTYRAARSGILTGILLGVARASGETAPLLFTALNNQFLSWGIDRPMANVPCVIFQFAMSPYDGWQKLAWAGALVSLLSVLVFNLTARILFRQRRGTSG